MTRPESVGHPLRAELLEPRDEGCRRSPITLEGLLERRGAVALCEEAEDDRELATSDDVLPAVARGQRELEVHEVVAAGARIYSLSAPCVSFLLDCLSTVLGQYCLRLRPSREQDAGVRQETGVDRACSMRPSKCEATASPFWPPWRETVSPCSTLPRSCVVTARSCSPPWRRTVPPCSQWTRIQPAVWHRLLHSAIRRERPKRVEVTMLLWNARSANRVRKHLHRHKARRRSKARLLTVVAQHFVRCMRRADAWACAGPRPGSTSPMARRKRFERS